MRSKWYRPWLYRVFLIAQALFGLLPFRLARWMAACVAELAFWLTPRHRRAAVAHLTQALGDRRAAVATARRLYRHLALNAVEWIKLVPQLSSDNLDHWITAEHFDRIDQVLAQGKGGMIISAHFGNWELIPIYFILKGYRPFHVLARQVRYPEFDRLINHLRRSKGVVVHDRDQVSFSQLAKLLRANQWIGIVPDQDTDSVAGVFVNFLGQPALTPAGPVQLALLTGAPLVPVLIVRDGKRHHIFIEEPIVVTPSGDRERDLVEYTQRWSRVLESYIRRWPDHWVWMHDRWKTVARDP